MTLSQIINEYGATGFVSVVALLSLVQITPIKVNPWSAVCRWFGRHTNAEVMDELQRQSALASRYRIIRFDDECRHRQRHTEEHFNQIIDDINKYEKYCREHPEFPNAKADDAMENIKKCRRKCKDENNFLV